jgi:hypothetical protein
VGHAAVGLLGSVGVDVAQREAVQVVGGDLEAQLSRVELVGGGRGEVRFPGRGREIRHCECHD